MPISKEIFNRGHISDKPTLPIDYVLDFLKKNKNNKTYAYKVPEISKETNKSESSVRNKVRELVKKGLVIKKLINIGKGHRIPYYKVIDGRGSKKKKNKKRK